MAPITGQNARISPSGHVLIRLLIASYYIGAASGAIPYEAGRAFAALLLPAPLAGLFFTGFLFTTAYLVLIGRQMRGAALLLALFIFWAGWFASYGPDAFRSFDAFWRDLAMIGGILLTYMSPTTPQRDRLGLGRLAKVVGLKKSAPAQVSARAAGWRSGRTRPAGAAAAAAFAEDPDDLATAMARAIDKL
jgi:hypothetical protein